MGTKKKDSQCLLIVVAKSLLSLYKLHKINKERFKTYILITEGIEMFKERD